MISSAYYACFVALEEEMEYIDGLLRDGGAQAASGTLYEAQLSTHTYYLSDPTTRLVAELIFFVNTEMGNIGSCGRVVHELNVNQYEAIFILGIAGTLSPEKYKLGDVVVAAGAKYLGFDKVKQGTSDGFVPDPRKMLGQSWLRVKRDFVIRERTLPLVNRYLRTRADGTNLGLMTVGAGLVLMTPELENSAPRLHGGVVLGTEWVIDSQEHTEFLLDRNRDVNLDWYRAHGDDSERQRTRWTANEPTCVDMETFGFFKALEISEMPLKHGFAVRGISDPCHNKSAVQNASRDEIRSIAARNAATVLIDLIRYVLVSDQGARR